MNCFAASILVAISANLWRITWKLADRAPERLALLRVLERLLEHPLGAGVAARGGDQPLALELPGDVVEALALLAEDGVGRDADVLEGELAGVGGVHAHLLELARDGEPGDLVALVVAQVDQEQGDPVVAPRRGRSWSTRTMKSARAPLVMNVFEPLITYSSPSRIAVVRIPATSEPAPGSVIPRQPIFSPLIPGTR